jgi:hypothetical protein
MLLWRNNSEMDDEFGILSLMTKDINLTTVSYAFLYNEKHLSIRCKISECTII